MIRLGVALAITVALAGCATPPDRIAATPVSAFQYQSYSCDQLGIDMGWNDIHTAALRDKLQGRANLDTATIAMGAVLWPMLLMAGGDGPDAAAYARLKGERDAMQQVARQKGCRL